MRNHNAALKFAEGQVAKKDKTLDDLDIMVRGVKDFESKGNRAMHRMLIELEDKVCTKRHHIQHNIDFVLSKEM